MQEVSGTGIVRLMKGLLTYVDSKIEVLMNYVSKNYDLNLAIYWKDDCW